MTDISEPLESAMRDAKAALNAKEYVASLDAAHKVLALDQNSSIGLHILGLSLERLGRYEESEAVLLRCVQIEPASKPLRLLANVQLYLQRFDARQKTLEALIEIRPELLDVYLGMAKYKFNVEGMQSALDILARAQAISPHDVEVALAIAYYSSKGDDSAEIKYLREFHSSAKLDLRAQAKLLRRCAELSARLVRRAQLLPFDYTISWDDASHWPDLESLGQFKAAAIAVLTSAQVDHNAFVDVAIAEVAATNWAAAEVYLRRAREFKTGHVADVLTFDPQIHEKISGYTETEIVLGLAPLETIAENQHSNTPTLFLASDLVYFEKFTLSFLADLVRLSPTQPVHIHLLDGDPEQWQRLLLQARSVFPLSISMSAEASDARQCYGLTASYYFHAVRFIRFYQHLLKYKKALWILDVDAKLNRDLIPDLSVLSSCDVAFNWAPLTLEPWYKIRGALIGAAPTDDGLKFARLVAGYIAYWMKKDQLRWGIDQVALFCSYVTLAQKGAAPKTHFLDSRTFSVIDDTSTLTFSSGFRKFL